MREENVSMSLRDYLAAAVVTGLLGRDNIKRDESGEQFWHIAQISYTIADMMMLARDEKVSNEPTT